MEHFGKKSGGFEFKLLSTWRVRKKSLVSHLLNAIYECMHPPKLKKNAAGLQVVEINNRQAASTLEARPCPFILILS